MHVKNHMPMWILWILWILRFRHSANWLYKPLCAFLVFVDLVWFLRGSFCGFWSCVVFGCGLVFDADADDCASTCRWALWICGFWLWSCPRCRRLRVHLSMGFVDLWICGSVDLWSCASTCRWALWTAKKICPLPNFVLCSFSSPLGATFTNGENDHG